MTLFRTVLAVFAGVSICMADNISGIVTNTASSPIAGALVQIGKSIETTTTGADGRFTLPVNVSIIPGNIKLLPGGFSAGITGNVMTLTIPKQGYVEITTLNICGRILSTMCKTFDAGNHIVPLPGRGTGIYLYMVKSGNSTLVLKSNAFGRRSSGNDFSSQSSSSDRLAKQALRTALISDIIKVTKAGFLDYRCFQNNSDTSGLVIKMLPSAGPMSDADGNVYQTVKIGNQIWMAENLRATKYNDGSPIPLDTSTGIWNNARTAKYCFYENTTNAATIKNFGALYNYHVISPDNLKKIAPAGWHVPSDSEWTILEKQMVLMGHNYDGTSDTAMENKIAKSLSAKFDWFEDATPGVIGNDLTKNNRSGFAALPGGYRSNDGLFMDQMFNCGWWGISGEDAQTSATTFGFTFGDYSLKKFDREGKSCGYSIRLVKDN